MTTTRFSPFAEDSTSQHGNRPWALLSVKYRD